MCGICGIVDFSDNPISDDTAVRMRDIMDRRGPDGAGLKSLPHATLGHRRLSIIDLTDNGTQPMTNEDGRYWITFNGEIYNFPELRAELSAAGHLFASKTDTEAILHGYEEWGLERLLGRLRGMFAFAIWDTREMELVVARDRLGKKPLYFGQIGERFYFASDPKAIWSANGGKLAVNESAIASFLFWCYIPGPQTIFRDVEQLPPGSWLRLNRRGLARGRYWRVSFADKAQLSADQAAEEVDGTLREAVQCRLISDVPLGVFLSGGVDSSLVTRYASEVLGEDTRTFTAGFSESGHDEREHAREVVRTCNTRHVEALVEADVKGTLPRLVWEYAQPFGDAAAIPTALLSGAARQNVTVALTGDGADESFAGYSHHQGRVLAGMISPFLPAALRRQLVSRSRAANERCEPGLVPSLMRFLRYTSPDAVDSFSNVSTWSLPQLRDLWPAGHGALYDAERLVSPAVAEMRHYDGRSLIDSVLFLDFAMLLPYCYNVKVDVAAMSRSLEARSPFLDHKVVELAARLPGTLKLRPMARKFLLKRLATRYFSPSLIYRPKHGFSVPIDEWVGGSWSNDFRSIVFGAAARRRGLFDYNYLEKCWADHLSGKARHGTRFWQLLWLELWFQMFIDGTRSPEDPLVAT